MYNKVIMIGRLTVQPELVTTPNDKSVTRVTLAVNRRFKSQNGERDADFIFLVVWGRLAETLTSYAGKGSLISVDGELRTRKYDTNGQTQYVTEVLCFPVTREPHQTCHARKQHPKQPSRPRTRRRGTPVLI